MKKLILVLSFVAVPAFGMNWGQFFSSNTSATPPKSKTYGKMDQEIATNIWDSIGKAMGGQQNGSKGKSNKKSNKK